MVDDFAQSNAFNDVRYQKLLENYGAAVDLVSPGLMWEWPTTKSVMLRNPCRPFRPSLGDETTKDALYHGWFLVDSVVFVGFEPILRGQQTDGWPRAHSHI